MKERLQKILAKTGVCSRRKAEEFISSGRVKINGKIAKLSDKADMEKDKIFLDDKPVIVEEKKAYYLLNKPKGYISSVTDDRGRKTVTELLPKTERIYPVGRLDYATEGLLLLTNDGELTNFLIHPKFEVEKTYIARVAGNLTEEKLDALRKGIMLEDGLTAPAEVRILAKGEEHKIEITIHEGRNREVRRMFAAVGCEVKALKRIKFAGLTLDGVVLGKYRKLSEDEVKNLYARFYVPKEENSGNRRGGGGNNGGDNGGDNGGAKRRSDTY